ncbi:MAG: uroporphyrinogen decarboxylase family protein, partial [Thermoproteota archaeon]
MGKEKMLKAMECGLEGGFPVVIPYVGIFLRDHWEEATDQPWWAFHDPNLDAWIKVEEDLLERLDMDWVSCGLCPPREWRESHKIEVDGNRVFIVDSSGKAREEIRRDPVGGSHIAIEKEPSIVSVEDVDSRIAPLDKKDLVRSGMLDYAKMVANRFGSEKFVCASIGTPYWEALCNHFGFKGMMASVCRGSGLVERALERLTENALQLIRAYAEAKVDGIWVEECLSSATEISLDQFKRFVLPYNEELFSETRKLGMKSI